MAEGHLNTAFAALGTLDILLKRCKDIFAFWQRIGSSTESIETFRVHLDWQRARLESWTQAWGIEQNLYARDQGVQRRLQDRVVDHLKEIDRISHDLSNLGATFPRLGIDQSLGTVDSMTFQATSSSSDSPHASNNSGSASISTMEKMTWATQEKGLNDKLGQLRSLLDNLHDDFPKPRVDRAGPTVFVSSIRSQDPDKLAKLSYDIEADSPLLRGLAWCKSIAYMTQGHQQQVSPLDRSQLVEIVPNTDKPKRFVGSYNGNLVLVEMKSTKVPRNAKSQSDILNARIENIILRLQHPKKPDELRTLSCLGATYSYSVTPDSFITDYNIVYKVDTPHFFSLREILRQSNRSESKQKIREAQEGFPLGRRFVVAQMLASAVLFLHLADWLHKAIRSDNVVFFAENLAQAGFTLPYLVGFEYSRPDAPDERTEDIVDEDDHVYYRHPQAHFVPVADLQQPLGGTGRYSKVFDIYSIGVILVELGLFKSARNIVHRYNDSKGIISGETVRNILLTKGVPELRFAMGELYANAARVCLDGSFDDVEKDSLAEAFSKHVISPLSYCQA